MSIYSIFVENNSEQIIVFMMTLHYYTYVFFHDLITQSLLNTLDRI